MSRNARKFSYIIFTACIILMSLLFVSTGMVYADSATITNENVYYQEGLEGIDGNEFSTTDLNTVISHDESLLYLNDLSNSKLSIVNNKLALIGSKEGKASFILLNANFEKIISYTQEVENTIALDLIYADSKYILLTQDQENSYIITFEQSGDEYILDSEAVLGQYNQIFKAQDDLLLLNANSYYVNQEVLPLQNSIDATYFNSSIYYLTYIETIDDNELALNILDLET